MKHRAVQLAAILLLLFATVVLSDLIARFGSLRDPELGAVFWIGALGTLVLAVLPHPEDWRLVGGFWLLFVYILQATAQPVVLGIPFQVWALITYPALIGALWLIVKWMRGDPTDYIIPPLKWKRKEGEPEFQMWDTSLKGMQREKQYIMAERERLQRSEEESRFWPTRRREWRPTIRRPGESWWMALLPLLVVLCLVGTWLLLTLSRR